MKIIFYSAQTGNRGSISSIKEQSIDKFEYWFAHDNHHEAIDNKGWNYINIANRYINLTPNKKHKLIKMIPRLLFNDFDYVIWLDCKIYPNKDFYKYCLDIIDKEEPNWLVCKNLNNRNLYQELNYSIEFKNLDQDSATNLTPFYRDREFFSTDTCWMIRKNTDLNHELGHQWFKFTDKCFTGVCRDQLTLPLCLDKNYLNMNHSIHTLERLSYLGPS